MKIRMLRLYDEVIVVILLVVVVVLLYRKVFQTFVQQKLYMPQSKEAGIPK
jgi:hypothetical protein